MKRNIIFLILILCSLCVSACGDNKADYPSFKGLPKDDSPLNTVNYKEFKPQLFCYEDNDIFFSWDGTVYQYSGEAAKALFAKNAYCLNCNNGKLYFAENNDYNINSRDEVDAPGFIYSYDIDSDDLRQITDFPISQFVVDDNGIFFSDFREYGDSLPTGICFLDERSGKAGRLYDGISYIEYGGYRLKYDWSGETRVIFFKDNEEYALEDVLPYWAAVNGDYFYYRSEKDKSLNKMSLLTGNTVSLKPYEISSPTTENEQNRYFVCMDYTVLKDEIYFIDNRSSLRRYNENTDDYTEIECEYNFKYLYSDNRDIYAVGWDTAIPSYPNPPELHFIKLRFNGDSAEAEILA